MQTERDNLIQVIANTNGINCFKRKEGDDGVIYNDFPNKVKSLIIYKNFVVHDDIVILLHISNLCLDCTSLRDRENPIKPYTKALFSIGCVSRYVAKGTTSLILNNME